MVPGFKHTTSWLWAVYFNHLTMATRPNLFFAYFFMPFVIWKESPAGHLMKNNSEFYHEWKLIRNHDVFMHVKVFLGKLTKRASAQTCA